MRAIHDAIENGIGKCGIAQMFVPAVSGQLTRDDGGAAGVAVVERFEQYRPGD
jgi:hypothetical protein